MEVAKLKPARPVLYALPRGGVPVACPIAAALKAPLDLLLVRKIGVPRQPQLAAGAVVDGEGRDVIWNRDVLRAEALSEEALKQAVANAYKEIERWRALYLSERAAIPVQDRTAVLVDDGMATGSSMRAAIAAVRQRGPRRIIVAIPVAARDVVRTLRELVEDVACLATPDGFHAVGNYYEDFHQLSDAEVISLLARTRLSGAP